MSRDYKINANQKAKYAEYELRNKDTFCLSFDAVLAKVSDRQNIKILDIGGASGYFAQALATRFSGNACSVFVVDTTRYDTWNDSGGVNFIEASADELAALFEEGTFDLIFANRVIHHLVKASWGKSLLSIEHVMRQMAQLLNSDGYLCITDHFYNGALFDSAASRIIFALTSCGFPPVASLCRKLGAESAGVGVCFLSKRLWEYMFGMSKLQLEIFNAGWIVNHKRYKRFFLFIKSCVHDNIMILSKCDIKHEKEYLEL
jgi:SAM-dependent methyltransferase